MGSVVAGVCIYAAVGRVGRGGAGEDAEGLGDMRSFEERVLHSGRRRDRPRIRGLPVPWVLLHAIGFPDCLLHHQGLPESSLAGHRRECGRCFMFQWDSVFADVQLIDSIS